MTAPARLAPRPPRMNADEFIAWAMEQDGRYELVDGEVFMMAPEKASHVSTKGEAFAALRAAIRAAGLDCRAYTDGLTVRVSADVIYEPDALVRCGPRLPGETVEVSDPLIVVEVLSPSTRHVDTGKKLTGYLALPSVRHYLVLDGEARSVTHHRRAEADGPIETRILLARAGEEGPDLLLDPPGLSVRVADLFEAP